MNKAAFLTIILLIIFGVIFAIIHTFNKNKLVEKEKPAEDIKLNDFNALLEQMKLKKNEQHTQETSEDTQHNEHHHEEHHEKQDFDNKLNENKSTSDLEKGVIYTSILTRRFKLK